MIELGLYGKIIINKNNSFKKLMKNTYKLILSFKK